jgi:hypothetical protein
MRMATRKKAKTKPKRRKVTAKRPVVRRKAVRRAPAKRPAARKKIVRKAPARRAAPKAVRRKAARPKAIRPQKPAAPLVPAAPGERIGIVTHFYGGPSVAIIKLESGSLRIGDTIHVRGHTTDFSQRVDSLQVEHAPVEAVGPEDDFGVRVDQHVREHDVVYKVTS